MRRRSFRQPRFASARAARSPRRRRVSFAIFLFALSIGVPALAVAATAAGVTGETRVIAAEVQRFLLFYAGVFALVALTVAVAAGLLATDRIVMSPGNRVVTQTVHRAVSLIALSALGTHIMLEIVAQRANAVDAVVPFLARRSTFYMGLGTIASDLVVIVVVNGIMRKHFAAGSRPWVWRALHASAYLAWPMAIVHGLLAGRPAKPYVDWSYGGCLAAVGLALAIRCVATVRGRDVAGQPVHDRASWSPQADGLPVPGIGPARGLAAQPGPLAPRQYSPPLRALPPPDEPGAGYLEPGAGYLEPGAGSFLVGQVLPGERGHRP